MRTAVPPLSFSCHSVGESCAAPELRRHDLPRVFRFRNTGNSSSLDRIPAVFRRAPNGGFARRAGDACEGRKSLGWRASSFLSKGCSFFASHAMCPSPMSSELKTNLELEIKGKPPTRRAAAVDVRLSPLPARNMLMTVLFFSAVAAAILYWIFFPPTASHAPESSPAPTASPASIRPD
jgi:hypothetical protein